MVRHIDRKYIPLVYTSYAGELFEPLRLFKNSKSAENYAKKIESKVGRRNIVIVKAKVKTSKGYCCAVCIPTNFFHNRLKSVEIEILKPLDVFKQKYYTVSWIIHPEHKNFRKRFKTLIESKKFVRKLVNQFEKKGYVVKFNTYYWRTS